MKSSLIELKNKTGLHARPASQFVSKAKNYDAEIEVEKDNICVNGKSIMGLMTLGASYRDKITLKVNGKDEDKALEELEELIRNFK